jgi:hypothetical protein
MKYNLERTNANDEYATLVELHFENRSFVDVGTLIMTFETSKVAFDIETTESGEVFTNLKVGQEVSFGDVVAYQNEKPTEVAVETQENTIFTEKAKELLKSHNLSESEFSKMPFVAEKDVLAFVDAGIKQVETVQSALHNYIEPPVAYMRFSLRFPNSLSVLIFDIIKKALLPLVDTRSLHLLVNHNCKIVPYELENDTDDPNKLMNKAALEVYRGKKNKLRSSGLFVSLNI